MSDCRNLTFSAELSRQRTERAQEILGTKVTKGITCFGMYLLGVDRKRISDTIEIPPGSVRSIIRAVHKGGLPAFEDRRQRASSFLPPPQPEAPAVRVYEEDAWVAVDFGVPGRLLKIPRRNRLQIRVVLLSMLNSGLLSKKDVAAFLELSTVHTGNLAQRLEDEDILALIDKRRGQQKEYRFTPEVKAELIQQFVLDVLTEGKTTGTKLCERLRERCQVILPDRSIRFHVEKLGLKKLKESLPELLEAAKKNSKD